MNQALFIATAMGGETLGIVLFILWVFVNALGVIGLVMLVARRYLAAMLLGCVPWVCGMAVLILLLYWRDFDVASVLDETESSIFVAVFAGIPLVLGWIVVLLGDSGRRKARRSAERHP